MSPPFHITIANFDKVELNSPDHQKVGKVPNALQIVVIIKDERLSYLSRAKITNEDSLANSLHYTPSPDRLKE